MTVSLEDILTPEGLLDAITKYRELDLRNATLAEVESTVGETFARAMIANNVCNFGGPLFRVRPLDDSCTTHKLWPDVGWPPAESARLGRANGDGESVFYAALDPVTAIRETRIVPGNRFSLVLYQLNPRESWRMSSVRIGPRPPKNLGESRDLMLGARILYDFAFSEFTRQVGSDAKFQYKASCAIARQVLADPNRDSVLYPSVFDRRRENIVLRTDAANERVTARVVVVCRLGALTDSGAVSVSAEAVGCSTRGSDVIDYHAMDPGLITPNSDLGLNAVTTLLEGKDPWPSIESAMGRATEESPHGKLCGPSS